MVSELVMKCSVCGCSRRFLLELQSMCSFSCFCDCLVISKEMIYYEFLVNVCSTCDKNCLIILCISKKKKLKWFKIYKQLFHRTCFITGYIFLGYLVKMKFLKNVLEIMYHYAASFLKQWTWNAVSNGCIPLHFKVDI